MKRGTFKKPKLEQVIAYRNKPRKALKRSKTPLDSSKKNKLGKGTKKKKNPIKSLKLKLWELCKQIIRLKYRNKDGTWNCYTCGKLIDEPAKAQTGHFLASSVCGAYLRYDLRNLRIQDYYCNINLGGNGATFYKNLVDREGQEYVDEIFKDKQKIIKADEWWYISKIAEYEVYLLRMQEAMQ